MKIAKKMSAKFAGVGVWVAGFMCSMAGTLCAADQAKPGSSTNFVGRHPEVQFCESPAFEQRPKAGYFASKCS